MVAVTTRRTLKLILPLLVLAEIVLVWLGIVELGDALLAIVALEALLMLAGVGGLVFVVKRYRHGRKTGFDPLQALEDGLSPVLPLPVARIVTHEFRIFGALFKWIFGRNKVSGNEFSYHKGSLLRSLIPMLVLVIPVELFVVHLLVYGLSPWAWLGWVLLGLEIYAFSWLLGLYATLVTLPHRLEDKGLRLHYGLLAEAFVPYDEIRQVLRKERRAPSSGDGLQHYPEEDSIYLTASGKTDLTLFLRSPRSVLGFFKESNPASCFHLAADEPERFASEIRLRVDEQSLEDPNPESS